MPCIPASVYSRCRSGRLVLRRFFSSYYSDILVKVLLSISFLVSILPSGKTMTIAAFNTIEVIFVGLFVLEASLRVLSMDVDKIGKKRHFHQKTFFSLESASASNSLVATRLKYICCSEEAFDLIIVIPMLILACCASLGEKRWIAVRGIRVFRSFRLFSMQPRMWAVIQTVYSRRHALFNVCGLILIVVFVFVVIGSSLYADAFRLEATLLKVMESMSSNNYSDPIKYPVAAKVIENFAARQIEAPQSQWQMPCPVGPTGVRCRHITSELSSIPGFGSISASFMTLIQLATFDNLAVLSFRLTHIGNGDAAMFQNSLLKHLDSLRTNASSKLMLPNVPEGAISRSYSAAVTDSSPSHILFILAFIIAVPMFLVHMFVAVFTIDSSACDGMKLLSENQVRQFKRTSLMYGARPRRGYAFAPQSTCRKYVHSCIMSGNEDGYVFRAWVDYSIMGILVLDMILSLSLPQSVQATSLMGGEPNPYSVIRLVFFFIYLVEWVFKLVALGPSAYICTSDFITILDTVALLFVAVLLFYGWARALEGNSVLFVHSLLKIRYLRLVTHLMATLIGMSHLRHSVNSNTNEIRHDRLHNFRSFWNLKHVFSRALPSLSNILMVLAVFVGTYAVIGCCLFANNEPLRPLNLGKTSQTLFAAYSPTIASPSKLYREHGGSYRPFDDFWHSLLSLLRILTKDHWSEIYFESTASHGSVFTFAAAIYFLGFLIMTGPILGSLAISVVYDKFMELHKTNDDRSMLSNKDAAAFESAWQHFDRYGRGLIAASDLPFFLEELVHAEKNVRSQRSEGWSSRKSFMDTLRKTSYLSSRQESLQKVTAVLRTRCLVPQNATQYWIGKAVDRLSPYAYDVPLFSTFSKIEYNAIKARKGVSKSRKSFQKKESLVGMQLQRSKSFTKPRRASVGYGNESSTSDNANWFSWLRSNKDDQIISVLPFSRVLMYLVHQRLTEQANRLQNHIEIELDKEAEIEASTENLEKAHRCPVCRMIEEAIMEQAEQIHLELEMKQISKQQETILSTRNQASKANSNLKKVKICSEQDLYSSKFEIII